MNAPKLSVIIPVYQVERYLARCVESVLAQPLTDMEILLVDDGGADACPALCEAYARQDARVRVIHQANTGLAGARNSGLRVARGEYVAFLDSDDWVEAEAYAKLYAKARQYDADIVFCRVRYFDDARQVFVEAQDEERDAASLPLFEGERFTGSFSWRDVGADRIFSYDSFVSACNAIYRRAFLAAQQADFPLGCIYEDTPWYFQTLFAARRLAALRERLLCYRVKRKHSIMFDVANARNAKALHVLPIMAAIDARLRGLVPEREYRRAFEAYAYSEIRYKFALIPEALHAKYLALAQGILPPALSLKLRAHVFLKRLRPLSWRSFIRYVHAPGLRKLELLRTIPLASVEKSASFPGQFDTIIAFGESPAVARCLAELHPHNGFVLYARLNACDIEEQYSILITQPADAVHPVRRDAPDGRSPVENPREILESIRSLLAISGSVLFVDFAERTLPAKRLKLLLYSLSAFHAEKDIRYLRLCRDTNAAPERPVPGLRFGLLADDASLRKRLRRILRGMELRRFRRFLTLRILGLPVLTVRRR